MFGRGIIVMANTNNQLHGVIPEVASTLKSFIATGKEVPLKYGKFCFEDNMDYGAKRPIFNVLRDYKDELLERAMIVNFNKEERVKYTFNPKRLAYDVYGSTDLYSFILFINNMSNIKEFDLRTGKCKLIHRDVFKELLSMIYTAEKKNLDLYNYKKK